MAEAIRHQFVAEAHGQPIRVTYKLRDWLYSRQRTGASHSIVYDGDNQPVPFGQRLTVTLPELVDFKPQALTPTMMFQTRPPLARASGGECRSDLGDGNEPTDAVNVMPQWAGSC